MSEPPTYPSDPQPEYPDDRRPQPGYPPQNPPQGYPQPGYAPEGYSPQGYGPQDPYGQQPGQLGQPGQHGHHAANGGAPGVKVDLGVRAQRRPDARTSTALAGAGAALAIVGLLVWAGGYLVAGLDFNFFSSDRPSFGSDSRRFLGAGLFAVLLVIGYGLVISRRRGPLATAGAVLAAFSVPLVLLFLTLSLNDVFSGGSPLNVDVVYIVSVLVWLVTYLFVPGARGRALFLTASLISAAGYVAFKIAGDDLTRSVVSQAFGGRTSAPSTGGYAAVGIAFGVAYYLVAALLDHRGRSGVSVAFVIAGFQATAVGIAVGSVDFGIVGTAVILIVVGALLTIYGGRTGRRFTTWVWAFGLVLGLFLLVAKIVDGKDYTVAGIVLFVVGTLVIAAGAVYASVTGEPAEIEDATPSALPRP